MAFAGAAASYDWRATVRLASARSIVSAPAVTRAGTAGSRTLMQLFDAEHATACCESEQRREGREKRESARSPTVADRGFCVVIHQKLPRTNAAPGPTPTATVFSWPDPAVSHSTVPPAIAAPPTMNRTVASEALDCADECSSKLSWLQP
jgi:hypothetical protein